MSDDQPPPYERHRQRAGERQRQQTRAGQDIAGGWPGEGNADRRSACRLNLPLFLRTYFPAVFSLPWSADHPRILAAMQARVLDGGLQALAEPRGYGKTSKALRAMLWALLYRHRRYGCLIGPTESHAKRQLLKPLKFELLYNDLLAEDFPHVCYPIRRLENNARRAAGQLFRGEHTRVEWTGNSVSFPVMPDDVCPSGLNVGGSVVTVAGLTSSLRGQSHVLPSGEVVRPEFVIADDPQTRDSARSLVETENRVAIVTGDVLGMAGPGKEMTVIMPCTVIETGDLADQMLDRQAHPEWHGERAKAVYAWPTNEGLWEQYHEARADELRNGGDGRLATEFYRERRAEMDRGAVVAWPERFNPDELSAVQHVQNALQKLGRRSFFAEYQNEPLPGEEEAGQLQADQVAGRVNGLARGVVPLACSHVVAAVDVQQRLLYWLVCAFADDLGGAVVDYGTYPDQGRAYFAYGEAQRTLARAAPGAGVAGAIYAGLGRVAELLLAREWRREDGAAFKVERLLVDAGYATDTVKTWCRQTHHSGVVLPSHGRQFGAKAKPLSEYAKKPGERLGFHWLVSAATGRQATRHLVVDTSFWKSLVAERLKLGVGDRGALAMFGKPGQDHRLLADHLTAEYSVLVEAQGRQVLEWSDRPDRRDNHWWDCLVGCAAAASLQGCQVSEAQTAAGKRKRVSFKEQQRRARERRKETE